MLRYCVVVKLLVILLIGSAGAFPASAPEEEGREEEEKAVGCPELILSDDESSLQLTESSRSLLPRDLIRFSTAQEKATAFASAGERDVELCKGRRRVETSAESEEDVYVVTGGSAQPSKVIYILVPMATANVMSEPVTMTVRCPHTAEETKCFNLLPKGVAAGAHQHVRLRREAQQSNHHSDSSDTANSESLGRIAWMCAGGLGLVGLLVSLAICAHSSEGYEPDFPDSRASEEVATPTEAGTSTTPTSAAPKSESMMNLLEDESSSAGKSATISMASNEGARLKELSDSQDPILQSGNEPEVRSKEVARSGLPTLEVANPINSASQEAGDAMVKEKTPKEEPYASVKKPDGKYDYVDKKRDARIGEDEAGYAYATVGGAMGRAVGEGPARPVDAPVGDNGQDERDGVRNKEKGGGGGGGLPPYGKVTRHMVPISKKSGYSEVLTSSSPLGGGGARSRAITDPVDPTKIHSPKRGQVREGMRDERAFTESAAHLPLPQIPSLDVTDETYDSIPDGLREGGGGGTRESSEGGANSRGGIRESVYESVEVEGDPELAPPEAEEDMYESVPEDVKQAAQTPSSPDTLSPSSPFPPPPRSPIATRTKSTDTPPASPLPKDKKTKDQPHHGGKDSKSEPKKHKTLSKAKSDTVSESRGRTLSSIFGRKKSGPANSPSTPKQKKQHEPLPKLPSIGAVASPTHLLPPSPPIPAPPPPEEVEDDDDEPADSAYDTVEVINPKRAAEINIRKAKSASLPASMRASGASMLHTVDHGPLPDVPEESSGGVVTRKRVQEDMDPQYDTVVLGQVHSDPSYDSVEASAAHRDNAMPKLEPAKPLNQPPAGEAAAAPPEERSSAGGGQTPANKYARVSSHAAADSTFSPPDLSAFSPEHDELGYAVIPAHLKMRKRAMSDAVLKKSEDRGRARTKSVDDDESSQAAPNDTTTLSVIRVDGTETEGERASTPPTEPQYESVTDAMKEAEELSKKENPYAKVDMAAKRRSQLLKQQSGADNAIDPNASQIPRDPSPNPPPLPDQGDLGDLTEYNRPPVPLQAKASLELMDPEDLKPKTIKPYSQVDLLIDPPYASVKKNKEGKEESKTEVVSDPPYASLKEAGESKAKDSEVSSDPPYASVKNKTTEEGGRKADGEEVASDPPYASVRNNREVSKTESEQGQSDPPYASVRQTLTEKPSTEEIKSERDYEEENPYSTVLDNSERLESPSGPIDPPYAKVHKGKVVEDKDEGPGYAEARSKCLAGVGTGESATVVESVNGIAKREREEEEEEDMYDKLDHGLGGAGGRVNNVGLSPLPPPTGEDTEYSTLTVDFSMSPDFVVTHTDSLKCEENGVVRQVEETTINFND